MTSRCPASSRCSSAGVGSPRTSATSHANDAPPAVLGRVCAKQRNNPKHTSSSSRACFVKQLCADVSLPQPHLHNTSRHELERIRRRRPRACYIRNKVERVQQHGNISIYWKGFSCVYFMSNIATNHAPDNDVSDVTVQRANTDLEVPIASRELLTFEFQPKVEVMALVRATLQ